MQGHTYTPGKTRVAESDIKKQALCLWKAPPLAIPIGISIVFYVKKPKKPLFPVPTTRPDLDNLVKTVTDSLNGIVYLDDSLIVDLVARKRYAEHPEEPRTEVSLNTYV